jgi:hypothetical protein
MMAVVALILELCMKKAMALNNTFVIAMAILFINRDRKMTDTESRKLEADIVKTMAHTMELGAESRFIANHCQCRIGGK